MENGRTGYALPHNPWHVRDFRFYVSPSPMVRPFISAKVPSMQPHRMIPGSLTIFVEAVDLPGVRHGRPV